MKTVFKVGMEVYDQVFFPDTDGKIVEIHSKNDKIQLEVKFFSKYRLEPLCMQSSVFYTEKGNMNSAWDRTCETPTLSTKPYKVELQGFEQKAPVPTFEEAEEWIRKEYAKGNNHLMLKDTFEALRKLTILREYYNKGYNFEWLKNEYYAVVVEKNEDTYEIAVRYIKNSQRLLFFKSREIAEKFLEEQIELLEAAKPLL